MTMKTFTGGRRRKTRKKRGRRRKTRQRTRRRTRRKRRRRRRRRGGVSALWSAAAEIGSKEQAQKKRENKEMSAIGWQKGDRMCSIGGKAFTTFRREHHCRSCGKVVFLKVCDFFKSI